YGALLNSLDETSSTYRRLWTVAAQLDGRWLIPATPNNLTFNAGIKWNDRRLETLTDRRLLFPLQPEGNDLSRPQEFMPERKLEANASVGYSVNYKGSKLFNGNVGFTYAFRHQHVNSTRDYFLTQPEPDGALPSVTDALQHAALIPSMSYDYTLDDDDHSVKVSLTNWFPHLKPGKYQPNFGAAVNLHYAPGSISYRQAGTDHFARRRQWYAEPELRFNIDDIGCFSYKYNATLPSLRDLLDVADAANPLYIFTGNSALKTSRMHEVWLLIYHIFRKGPQFEFTYRKYDNLIAQSADYDMLTGVTVYRPVNVNGNWDITARLNHYGRLGSGDKWWLESVTKVFYQNSVDVISSDISTVRNLNLGENLKLTYKIMSGMEISANGKAEWRRATSPLAGFDPVSAVDFDYGVIFRATKLPWNVSFTTDLMMHSRRGYADSRLNTDDLVWNARLAKSILHGNLTFALEGFEILCNLSNGRLTLISQGRTETRYNTLPRYALLHVIYRLNLQPKKR
ncbi:MAG: outer membrane beta-barrel protein, partial [Muribaculaceae bacterium]|nr:outer membrane beta-barrel protein [Muribaculaceae bacterium]